MPQITYSNGSSGIYYPSGIYTVASGVTTVTDFVYTACGSASNVVVVTGGTSGLLQSYAQRYQQQQRDRPGRTRPVEAELDRAIQREQEQWRERMIHANSRAEKLLRSLLSREQADSLDARGFFVVTSPRSVRYAIFRFRAGNVYRLDPPHKRLCAHPLSVPGPDSVVAQKFMLETEPEQFERVANEHRLEPDVIESLGRMGLLRAA